MRGTTATRIGRWAFALALAMAPAAHAQTEGASEDTSDAAPSDAQPTDAQPAEQPAEAQPAEQPPEAQPAEAQPSEPREEEPGEAQPSDAEPSEDPPAEGEHGAPAPPPWRWPGAVVWSIALRVGLPPQSSFDRALVSHGYGDVRAVPALVTGFALPAGVEWLWLGGQLGVRGRTWSHSEREDASMVGVDLLAVARLRFLLGERVELGVAVGGGVGWVGVWVNDVATDRVVGRFDARAELAFRVGRYFAVGPHVGWDYFQLEGINAYGSGVDAGGPYLGLTLEGRE